MKTLMIDFRRSRVIRRSKPREHGVELIAIMAVVAMAAIGTYSTESHGAERKPAGLATSSLRGSVPVTNDQSIAADATKVAVVTRPLDLKSLPPEAFDDGVQEPHTAVAPVPVR